MTHTWYRVAPRDPLMVRDGRPFSTDTDGARSLDFPPPSVLAGMVRGRIGRDRQTGRFTLSPEAARAIPVAGPLLVRATSEGTVDVLFPAPRDFVLMRAASGTPTHRFRLHPASAPFALSSQPGSLLPVVPVEALPDGKPQTGDPFWSSAALQRWLNSPPAGRDDPLEHWLRSGADRPSASTPETAPGLAHERRIHVGINPSSSTAADGSLFQTDGLRFHRRGAAGIEQFALLVGVGSGHELTSGLEALGGERRLAEISPHAAPPMWNVPSVRGRARVVLLTPAIFTEGAVPPEIAGAKVVAAAVGRPQTISGWDLAARGPKPSRRMAPAGSVYWVDLAGQDGPAWAAHVHFKGICSAQQDNLDGFGLAAVGVWP